jgi:hypothetical protein
MKLINHPIFKDEQEAQSPGLIEVNITRGSRENMYLLDYTARLNGKFEISHELSETEEFVVRPGTGLKTIEVSRETGATLVSFSNENGDLLYKSKVIMPDIRHPKIILSLPEQKIAETGVLYRILYRLENKDLIGQGSVSIFSPSGENLLVYELGSTKYSSGYVDCVFREPGQARAESVVLPTQDDLEPQTQQIIFNVEKNSGLVLQIYWQDQVKRSLAWRSKGYQDIFLTIGNTKTPLPTNEGVLGSFPLIFETVGLLGTTAWGETNTVSLL